MTTQHSEAINHPSFPSFTWIGISELDGEVSRLEEPQRFTGGVLMGSTSEDHVDCEFMMVGPFATAR